MADDVSPLYAIGWQHLMVARLRNVMGDPDGSARAAGDAAACFAAVGDRRGDRALQSARKDGTVTMPS
jgi:hypothetical protein